MRRTVGVPAETTLNMVSLHRPVTRNDVLNGRGQQMTVVRGTGSEGRAIVEGVGLLLRRQFELSLESIDLLELGVSHGDLGAAAGRDGRTVHWARMRSSSLGQLTAMISVSPVVCPEKWCNGIQLFWSPRLTSVESQSGMQSGASLG